MRHLSRLKYLPLLVATCLSTVLVSRPALAQTPGQVQLFPPELQQFPAITLGMDVRDASGRFLSGIKKDQVTLLENGQTLAPDDLKESQTPLEVSVAINPTPSMAVLTPDGRSRFTAVTDALADWAGEQTGAQLDHFNLFVNNNTPATDLAYRSDWLAALQGMTIDPQNAKPAFDSLSQALGPSAEASPTQASPTSTPAAVGDSNATRAILWITSPPEGQLVSALPALVDQAQKARVHLFVWSISPAVAFHTAGAQALAQAAAQTGGQFFAYSGHEALPKLDDWFNPLRGRYTLRYTTHAHASGAQSILARVRLADGTLESPPLAFQLNLLPPNPVLLSPPAQIVRTCPADCPDPAQQLNPPAEMLRILVEFPDKHPRTLAATRLYVDGQLAAERTSEPFNQLSWDLSGLTASSLHRVSVEAVDQLGLSKRSVDVPVRVEIRIPSTPAWLKLVRQPGFRAGAEAAGAFAVLAAGYFAGRRFYPAWQRRWASWRAAHLRPSAVEASPGDEENEPAGKLRTWLGLSGKPAAQLLRLEPAGPPVPLAAPELTFGQDAARAEIVLDDPSVDPLHARLVHGEDGSFRIFDHGSVAGTWVNYEPVPEQGTPLHSGDLVHLGGLSFRFELADAPHREVVIEKLDPDP